MAARIAQQNWKIDNRQKEKEERTELATHKSKGAW